MTSTDIINLMAAVARKDIRPDLARAKDFPWQLWQAMGEQGLLNPDRFREGSGGQGACQLLTQGALVLAREGGCLGLTLSWIIHHLASAMVLDAVSPDLAQALRTGTAILSFAVSEPQGGGHPKYISTRAQRTGAGWNLSGEKTYLTNGPVASAYVVIAVTGQREGRKSFSAFLVLRDTPGLTVLPAMALPFFNPSPHGGIRLENCQVGPESLVGQEGRAYENLVLRFRQWEDALMTGAVAGAMDRLVCQAAQVLQGQEAELVALGRLKAMADAAQVLSGQVARIVDTKERGREGIHLYFRSLAAAFIQDLESAADQAALPEAALLADLKGSASLGKTISRIRLAKLGQQVKDASEPGR